MRVCWVVALAAVVAYTGNAVAQSIPGVIPAQSLSLDDQMVFVPAGEFSMGADGVGADALPVHTVSLDAFWIDKAEVTVRKYDSCVDASVCSPPGTGGAQCNWGQVGRADHPVNCVTWDQADTYCAWTGKRLPTEAEWEKAGRSSDERTFPWGDEPATCNLAVMNDSVVGGSGCGFGLSAPVGSKPAGASPYGALDMAGNVLEWLADWYDESYYSVSPPSNPPGPASGTLRVFRGGDYSSEDQEAARRYSAPPSFQYPSVGIRCAVDANGCEALGDLVLSDDTILTMETVEWCGTIVVGPNWAVGAPGEVTLRAGHAVILLDDVQVGIDAELAIEIDPALDF